MTTRLYYPDSELFEFDAVVADTLSPSIDARRCIVLDQTAFYPTSGGQLYDTGWLQADDRDRIRVSEVAETEDGRILHYLETTQALRTGAKVRGMIDHDRRRDHMQQHSGQHVLSAAFIELFEMPTVSFHMGDDYCSIDLATPSLSQAQIVAAEKRANEIIFENRTVGVRFVSRDEAERLGLRKLPPAERDELRLIEIADYDRSACGGTHVRATGQIGSILLRKTEKVRQAVRVEFVCGERAVRTARRDYSALTDAAGLFSSHLWDVPTQVRKGFDDARILRRQKDDALEALAEATAAEAVRQLPERDGRRVIVRSFTDRDISFAKLFAQKATRVGVPVIALVASLQDPAGVVFAQSVGGSTDIGGLLKEVLASVGGRGGGSHDFAQGGVPAGTNINQLLQLAASKIES